MRFLFSILMFVSAYSFSAQGTVKGKIEYVRIHDGNVHALWKPPTFWFTLQGVSSAGSCGTWNGNVLFVMDSEQAYSMILAAYMADKEISVHYIDTIPAQDGRFCKATQATMGDPPPLM